MVASSAAPMNRAPIAEILINDSMANGVPLRVNTKASFKIGTNPTIAVKIKAYSPAV